jgi:LysR family glycine cleavage system transcriptional activator
MVSAVRSLMIQPRSRAAIDGFGVMMGITQLLTEEIDAGRLVAPFETDAAAEFGYYLVYRPGALSVAKVSAFRDFLIEQAEASAR